MKLAPLSSDIYRMFTVCPWKAHAHVNLGLAPDSGPAAEPDIEVRHVLAHALHDRLTPEEARQKEGSPKVRDFVSRPLSNDPSRQEGGQLVDQYVAIDECGRLVTTDPDRTSEEVIAHGSLDRIILDHGEEMVVVGWTTVHDRSEDAFERHLSAGLLARALFPESRIVRFIKHNIRTGNRSAWVYTFNDSGSSVSIQGPRGRPSVLRDKDGPLVAYLRAIVRRIEATEPKPVQGDHCTDWNGSRCRFLGAECPLGPAIPAVVDEYVRPVPQDSSTDTLRRIASDPDFEILPEHASWAWNGVLQLEHFIGQIKKRLKEWAKENGPIRVGDDRYGWATKTENVVDAVHALQFMLDTRLPLETICKALNISKTSIERLPKEFHHIKVALLGTAVTPKEGKPRFGLMER